MAKDKDKQKKKKKEKSEEDKHVDHHYSKKCVIFLNVFSFAAGVFMCAVGGLLIYQAFDGGDPANAFGLSVDKWISTIYSVIMGLLVLVSSGESQKHPHKSSCGR